MGCGGLFDVRGAAASGNKVERGVRRRARWGRNFKGQVKGQGGRRVAIGMGGEGGRGAVIQGGNGAVVWVFSAVNIR